MGIDCKPSSNDVAHEFIKTEIAAGSSDRHLHARLENIELKDRMYECGFAAYDQGATFIATHTASGMCS